MAPPATATAAPARRHAGGQNTGSPRRWGRGAAAPGTDRRSPLRVVPSRSRRRTLVVNRRLVNTVSISIVVAALLAVVVAQAFLTNGQVKLSGLQHQLMLEQSAHRQAELAVAGLETPSRIVAAASGQGMVRPATVTELPYVSLSVPLPTPKVTPGPPPATTATTTPASSRTTASGATSTGAAGTAGSTGASGTAGSTGASGTAGSSTKTTTSTP